MPDPRDYQTPDPHRTQNSVRHPGLLARWRARHELRTISQTLRAATTTPAMPLPQTPAPELPSTQAPDPRADRVRRGLTYRVGEAVGMVPLFAPLLAAGYYQADLAHQTLQWEYPWAFVFPAAIEGGAAYAATLYHRKLVAGDSTVGARIGMLAYAAASSGLLWWHARQTGQPWQVAAAIGGMTVAAVWIWTQRARWLRRDDLRRQGKVDAQVVRFSLASWIAAPIETPRALRYSIKHRLTHPIEAIEAYREDRRRRRTLAALRKAREAVRKATRKSSQTAAGPGPVAAGPVQTPSQAPAPEVPSAPPVPPTRERTRPDRSGPKPRPEQVRTLRSADDEAALAAIAEWAREHERTPSLDDVQLRILNCGRSRAVRLNRLYNSRQTPGAGSGDQSDDEQERDRDLESALA